MLVFGQSCRVQAKHAAARGSSYPCEIDEALLDIGANEPDAHMIADVQSVEAMNDLSLGRRARNSRPGAFVGGPGDNGVELLADARRQEQRGGGFADLTLDLTRIVLLFGAMRRQRAQLIAAVSRRSAGQCSLQQALRDQIRKAPVRRGRMRVV